MDSDFLKNLWLLRAKKLKKSEEEAAWKYQEILDRFLIESEIDQEVVQPLRQLVLDERMHERLADELLQIVMRNHPECSIFTS